MIIQMRQTIIKVMPTVNAIMGPKSFILMIACSMDELPVMPEVLWGAATMIAAAFVVCMRALFAMSFSISSLAVR